MSANQRSISIWSISLLLLIALLMPAMSGCTQSDSTAPTVPNEISSQNITLKYSGYRPPGDNQETVPAWYAEELFKRTNGKVKIECYHGEMLGKVADFPEMLRGGVCDIANINRSQTEFVDSLWQVAYMPFVSSEDMIVTEQSFFLALHKGLFDSFLGDYKVMWLQPTPPQYLFLRNKKVTSEEDFKGLKISGVSGVWVAIPEKLGATGVSIPGSEAYMSLDRGVVDGRITMPDFALSTKLFEVTHYVPWYAICGAGGFLIGMTKQRWDSLPVDVQTVMEQLNEEAGYRWLDQYYTTSAQFRTQLQQAGMEVYDLPDAEKNRWRTNIEELSLEQLKVYEDRGLPARQVFDLYRSLREVSE